MKKSEISGCRHPTINYLRETIYHKFKISPFLGNLSQERNKTEGTSRTPYNVSPDMACSTKDVTLFQTIHYSKTTSCLRQIIYLAMTTSEINIKMSSPRGNLSQQGLNNGPTALPDNRTERTRKTQITRNKANKQTN